MRETQSAPPRHFMALAIVCLALLTQTAFDRGPAATSRAGVDLTGGAVWRPGCSPEPVHQRYGYHHDVHGNG
jgi:hypothetical protein